MTITGGADGPTSIILAGELGAGWINIFGAIIVAIILIPNIIYGLKNRNMENICTNRVMNLFEQLGRYGCMFFMIFNIGLLEFGYKSVGAFIAYFVGNTILLAAYIIFWLFYAKKKTMFRAIALSAIPTAVFLLSGITLFHIFLIVFGVMFGVAHNYVTYVNHRDI